MLRALTNAQAIRNAQKAFRGRMNASLPAKEGTYTIGFQGDNRDVKGLRANEKIWYVGMRSPESAIPRFWNAFGLADHLNVRASNSIAVEINVPLTGIDRRVAGLFAVDTDRHRTVALHSGKVGGGKKGVGKDAFLKWYNQDPTMVQYDEDGQINSEMLVIADLSSKEFITQVTEFVHAVARFKDKVENDELRALSTAALAEKARTSRGRPRKSVAETTTFERNAYVSEYVKRRAAGICDLCGNGAPFKDKGDVPFLECHHIVWLANGGDDTIENAVALCPNCHRKMHVLGDNADVSRLKRKANKRESAV